MNSHFASLTDKKNWETKELQSGLEQQRNTLTVLKSNNE